MSVELTDETIAAWRYDAARIYPDVTAMRLVTACDALADLRKTTSSAPSGLRWQADPPCGRAVPRGEPPEPGRF